ncbi:MAG: hypothetical protein LLF98_02305 [Clostridium sp.]|uniref:hypothetical protein n=1 Tax=Clostridium sp. TaxID=1506 RepID=UPI0025BCA06E|nr:hypothetical protein [Clostridium sp.]MCE5220114.1 hypothetical protein [Clostridium sp.]
MYNYYFVTFKCNEEIQTIEVWHQFSNIDDIKQKFLKDWNQRGYMDVEVIHVQRKNGIYKLAL